MKFLRLELLNLASLDRKDGETIDFEEGPLGQSAIFSIVGPTGSGKSTLLDAICLPLYNRAPRYPRKKGDRKQSIEIYGEPDGDEKYRLPPTDSRNILTRGRKEGYSRLTFMANDGCVYRAEWYVRFLQKKYEEVTTRLYRITSHIDGSREERECDWETLPDIIGLDYDQFLRTVLIAQGSFANFLTAKENERYELLERLIGSGEAYTRLSAAIRERRDEASRAWTAVSSELAAVKSFILSDAELEEQNALAARLEREVAAIEEKCALLEKRLKWHSDLKALRLRVDACADAEKASLLHLQEMAPEAERLRLRDALLPAIDALRESRRLAVSVARAEEEVAAREKRNEADARRLEEENALLTRLRALAEEAANTAAKAAPAIREARAVKTALASAVTRLTGCREEDNKARTRLSEAMKEREAGAKAVEEAEARAKSLAEVLAALMKSTDADRARHDTACNEAEAKLREAMVRIESQDADSLRRCKEEADERLIAAERALACAETLGRLDAERDSLSAREKELSEANATLRQRLGAIDADSPAREAETLRRTLTLLTSEQWALHRRELHDGSPCPLCGATSHPYAASEELFDDAEAGLRAMLAEKERLLEGLRKEAEKIGAAVSANEGELRAIAPRLGEIARERGRLAAELQQLRAKGGGLPEDKDALSALIPPLKEAGATAGAALTAFTRLQREGTELQKMRDKAAAARDAFEKEASRRMLEAKEGADTAAARLDTLRRLIPSYAAKVEERERESAAAAELLRKASEEEELLRSRSREMLGGADPDEYESRLREAAEQARKDAEEKSALTVTAAAALAEAKGAVGSLRTALASERDLLAASDSSLALLIAAYNRDDSRIREVSREDVAMLLDSADSWESLRAEQERRVRALTSARALHAAAAAELTEHLKGDPGEEPEVTERKIKELRGSGERERLIEVRARLKGHADALARLGERAEELKRSKEELDDWSEITDAIGADGKTLRKIAQCYTLRFLIEHANAEIRKFNSRYELRQVRNSLGIRVIDHDRADDIRDTTSLSGGETFIVSLGLALGLSALSSANISFSNLFIDEGFGTLDPDTLATVIDSLSMLQTQQGKKVGVISHTDTMSERITTQIRVIPNGNTGSSRIEIAG